MATKWLLLTISETEPGLWDRLLTTRIAATSSTEARINGYDFGIILNPNGKVAEASYACIYILRDGVAITPPISAGILESITREVVKQLLKREFERTELYIADEAFICGTAEEVQAIGRSVDRYKIGDGEQGQTVARLRTLLREIARGEDDRYAAWRVPVYGDR